MNDTNLLGEWGDESARGHDTRTWDAEQFQQQLIGELGGEKKIERLRLELSSCTTTSLNELLAILYVNISEKGLKELQFCRFPHDVELDEILLANIARTAEKVEIFTLKYIRMRQ